MAVKSSKDYKAGNSVINTRGKCAGGSHESPRTPSSEETQEKRLPVVIYVLSKPEIVTGEDNGFIDTWVIDGVEYALICNHQGVLRTPHKVLADYLVNICKWSFIKTEVPE